MMMRTSLKAGNASATVTGLLLLAFSAASVACAFAAFYSVGDAAPVPAAPSVGGSPAAGAPVAQPMAGVNEPVRCAAAGARLRRNAPCRLSDLPSV